MLTYSVNMEHMKNAIVYRSITELIRYRNLDKFPKIPLKVGSEALRLFKD